MKPEDKLCKNGCMFATKMPTITTFKYEGESSGESFLWRCTKINQVVTIDTILHKVGCGSFMLPCDAAKVPETANPEAQAAALVAEVEQKIGEMAKENPAIAAAVAEGTEGNRFVANGGEFVGSEPVTEAQKQDAAEVADYLKNQVSDADNKQLKDEDYAAKVHEAQYKEHAAIGEIPKHPIDGAPLMPLVQIKEKVTDGLPIHQVEVNGTPLPLVDIAKPVVQEPKKRTRRTKAEMEAARKAEEPPVQPENTPV